MCNGHANVCDLTNPRNPFQLMCRCQHNTCGSQCETCCPGYVQKPWRAATLSDTNECERECFFTVQFYHVANYFYQRKCRG